MALRMRLRISITSYLLPIVRFWKGCPLVFRGVPFEPPLCVCSSHDTGATQVILRVVKLRVDCDISADNIGVDRCSMSLNYRLGWWKYGVHQTDLNYRSRARVVLSLVGAMRDSYSGAGQEG